MKYILLIPFLLVSQLIQSQCWSKISTGNFFTLAIKNDGTLWGLLEIVYKDALEIEFKENNIPFEREKEFSIEYKNKILPHKFYADFIVNEDIILEVKAVKEFSNEHVAQVLNYLKLADSEIGLLVNFQTKSLQYKRYSL